MPRRNLCLPLLAIIALSACQDAIAPSSPEADGIPSFSVQQQVERVVPGRVLVRFADDSDPAEFARANGVALERMAGNGRIAVLTGAVGSERALAARFGADVRVAYAEPDFLRQTTQIDPKLWAFYNPGGLSVAYTRGRDKGNPVPSLLSVADADMDNVEGYGAGGSPVAIASIDTGVEFAHPEFGFVTLVPGWDWVDDDADPSDTDDHGTHTTGTMVGDNVGVAGVAGAAGNVTVYVYRVCGTNGCPTSAIVNAIYDATNDGVVAMNLSLGGGSLSQSEADAIQYATDNGALVIASAGNDGTGSVSCPACDPNAISVAASDWLDEQAYYTNYGPGLDITAPGGEMYSNTTSEAGIWSAVRGGYEYFQGTSMAAPQVTGTAAVVASATGLSGGALRDRLTSTADDIGTPGYDELFGFGRLNSYRAVTGVDLDEGSPPPPGPDPLTAAFTFSCSADTCTFDGSGSTGNVTTYDWLTSDAGTGSSVGFSHMFASAGTYDVQLTVGDGTSTDSVTQSVECRLRGRTVRCK
jgi:subtilisin family serine protease